MFLADYIWNKTYGKSRITRKCHEDRLLFYDYCHSGMIDKVKYFLHTLKQHGYSKKCSFPEYEELYDLKEIQQRILENDIISFDIFDTLLFRPFCRPTDLFYILEHKNGIPDFRNIRVRAEQRARKITHKESNEINIYDIYDVIEEWCDVDGKRLAQTELETEKELCFGNPFMTELYHFAVKNKKEIIVASDMYIPEGDMKSILESKGYDKISAYHISCDLQKSKHTGKMQEFIAKQYPNKKIMHIGDDQCGDYDKWKFYANDRIKIHNVNDKGLKRRLNSVTTISGSVYAGIVNAHLYSGHNKECNNPYYEYGYVYGGILTLGFCKWLYETVEQKRIDKVLFMARDTKVVKDVYDMQYPASSDEYFLTSRTALLPVVCKYAYDTFLDEAFRIRFMEDHLTVEEVLEDLDLAVLKEDITGRGYALNTIIVPAEWPGFKEVLYQLKSKMQKLYCDKYDCVRRYVSEFIESDQKIILVDLGWRGTSILYLKYMIEKEFPGTKVYGAMFGTMDCSFSRMRIADGEIFSYLFSPDDYTYSEIGGMEIFQTQRFALFEHMYSATENSTIGYRINDDGNIEPVFEKKDISENNAMIAATQCGIMQFVKDYSLYTSEIKDIVRISKDVAIMPLYQLLKKEKKLYKLYKNFHEKKSMTHGFLNEE